MKKGNTRKNTRTEYIYSEDNTSYKVTVEKSGNKSVRIPVEDRTNDGGRHRKKFTAPTTAELQAAVTAYLKGEDEKHGAGLTYYNACLEFIESRQGLAATTIANRQNIFKNRFQSMHNIPIRKLTRQDIFKAINKDVTEKHITEKTLATATQLMVAVLTEYEAPCMTLKLKRDIARYVKPATRANKANEYSSRDDWENAPTAVEVAKWAGEYDGKDTMLTAISVLLDLHSLRSEETRGLKYSDVYEQGGKCYVDIRHTRKPIKSKDQFDEFTKNESSTRKILIDRRLFDMIHAQPHKSEDEFVINVPQYIYADRISRLMKAHGMDWITPHKMRHIFETSNLNNDIAVKVGGWSLGASVVKKTYTHIDQKEQDKFMTEYSRKLLDAYFGVPHDSESEAPEQEQTEQTAPQFTISSKAV